MFGEVQIVKGFFFVLKYVEYFIVYFMTVNYVSDRKQLRNLVIAIITVFVIVCLASIAQIPQGERITAPLKEKGGTQHPRRLPSPRAFHRCRHRPEHGQKGFIEVQDAVCRYVRAFVDPDIVLPV